MTSFYGSSCADNGKGALKNLNPRWLTVRVYNKVYKLGRIGTTRTARTIVCRRMVGGRTDPREATIKLPTGTSSLRTPQVPSLR
eukprot:9129306-Pyramimonas_sp.AAC.1